MIRSDVCSSTHLHINQRVTKFTAMQISSLTGGLLSEYPSSFRLKRVPLMTSWLAARLRFRRLRIAYCGGRDPDIKSNNRPIFEEHLISGRTFKLGFWIGILVVSRRPDRGYQPILLEFITRSTHSEDLWQPDTPHCRTNLEDELEFNSATAYTFKKCNFHIKHRSFMTTLWLLTDFYKLCV